MTKKIYCSRRQLVEIEMQIARYEAHGSYEQASAIRAFFSSEPLSEESIDTHKESLSLYLAEISIADAKLEKKTS